MFALAVFCPETGGVYLVPIDDLPTRAKARLRVEASRNGQGRGIRPAAAYEIARLPFAIGEPGAPAGGSGSSA